MDPRTLTDEDIDEALVASNYGRNLGFANIIVESQRRAEIRVNRVLSGMISQGQAAEKHDGSWYESRQTEEQFLDEMGVGR